MQYGKTQQQARKCTVLVVDDEELTRKLMRRVLKDFCDIKVVSSGEQALSALDTIKPDLILLDIMLKGMNGFEVCRRVRQNKALRLTKIILVSGMRSIPDRLEGYEAGADDFITKPFENEEFKAKVKVFLRLKRSEEVESLKTDLLELFGHETRTPLAGIIALSDMLSVHPDATEEVSHLARVINRNGFQLLEFVRKTQLICELKQGKTLNLAPGSAKWHLDKAIEDISSMALSKSVGFEISIGDLPEFEADWQMMREVFGYLLDNAVKYSEEGGKVKISARADNGIFSIEFEDEGEGIDLEWQHRIFDEFAIRDIKHHQKGQGLSLSISRHIARLHDGEIGVKSLPGKGSVFRLSFPIKQK